MPSLAASPELRCPSTEHQHHGDSAADSDCRRDDRDQRARRGFACVGNPASHADNAAPPPTPHGDDAREQTATRLARGANADGYRNRGSGWVEREPGRPGSARRECYRAEAGGEPARGALHAAHCPGGKGENSSAPGTVAPSPRCGWPTDADPAILGRHARFLTCHRSAITRGIPRVERHYHTRGDRWREAGRSLDLRIGATRP